MKQSEQGQILLELIVAVTIIIFVTASIAATVAISIRSTTQTLGQTTAVFLSQEMTEGVRAFTIESWSNLDQLATSSANLYHTTTTAGAWTHATGTEDIALNNITYTRGFWIDDVYRSTSTGNIVTSGGVWDPSTKKITTQITWTGRVGGANEFSQVMFVARYANAIYSQTDWSGGSVTESVVTEATTTFTTSTNINHASTSGSIKLGDI